MLKHKTISQITFPGYRIAFVETDGDYVVALGYRGHKESWEQGHYFPKSKSNLEEDSKMREAAANCYVDYIAKEIHYWL